MTTLLTTIFWIIVVLGTFIGVKYKQSRNKKVFFKEGSYRAFIWCLLMIIVGGLLITLVIPDTPFELGFLKLHSDTISNHADFSQGSDKYVYKVYSIFTELHLIGALYAVLISGMWFMYVRRLDFFKKEKLNWTILVLVFSVLATFFTFPLSDLINGIFSIERSDSNMLYNLFIYATIGIGVPEELIKLTPTLIILAFSKQIDEPIDLIYYACISALGFALIENLIYFKDLSGSIVLGRALLAAVGHMIDASIVVYGIILVRFRHKGTKQYLIPVFFLVGAFVHGLYDYLLIEGLLLIFAGVFAFIIQAWAIIINNAINNSKYFTYDVSYEHDKSKFYLAISICVLLLLSYLFNGFIYGRELALSGYIASVVISGLLLAFYIGTISSFDLIKGYWRPLKFQLSEPSDEAMPGARGFSIFSSIFTANSIAPINHVTKKVVVHAPPYNQQLSELLYISNGVIIDRISLVKSSGTDRDWFLTEIEPGLNVNSEFLPDKVLVKLESKYSSLVHDTHIRGKIRLLQRDHDFTKSWAESSKTLSMGVVIINGGDFVHENV